MKIDPTLNDEIASVELRIGQRFTAEERRNLIEHGFTYHGEREISAEVCAECGGMLRPEGRCRTCTSCGASRCG